MATTPEGKVKADVKKVLTARGIWFFMPMQNGFGVVGIPDFICCWRGQFLAIETKAPGRLSTLTANQERKIEEIKTHGGWAIVTDNANQVIEFLNSNGGDV
jgi:hypothetical protein